jgi:hypothetical protein
LSLVVDYCSLGEYCIEGERSTEGEREPSGIVRSSAGCEDQVLQLGAQEGREEERWRREDLLAKSADQNCKLYLNIS